MRLFARLFRLVWGGDIDRPLRPVLAVGLVGSIAGSCVWSFVGIWAIRRLGAGQTTLGLIFLASALVGIGAGYLGGHLSDHVGRRPLILVAWAGQAGLLLCFLAAGRNEVAGLGLICLGGLFFQLGSAADQPMIADLVPPARHEAGYRMAAWTSLSAGVVTLSERFGGIDVTPELFARMRAFFSP